MPPKKLPAAKKASTGKKAAKQKGGKGTKTRKKQVKRKTDAKKRQDKYRKKQRKERKKTEKQKRTANKKERKTAKKEAKKANRKLKKDEKKKAENEGGDEEEPGGDEEQEDGAPKSRRAVSLRFVGLSVPQMQNLRKKLVELSKDEFLNQLRSQTEERSEEARFQEAYLGTPENRMKLFFDAERPTDSSGGPFRSNRFGAIFLLPGQ